MTLHSYTKSIFKCQFPWLRIIPRNREIRGQSYNTCNTLHGIEIVDSMKKKIVILIICWDVVSQHYYKQSYILWHCSHALGPVYKFVLRCKNLYGIGSSLRGITRPVSSKFQDCTTEPQNKIYGNEKKNVDILSWFIFKEIKKRKWISKVAWYSFALSTTFTFQLLILPLHLFM